MYNAAVSLCVSQMSWSEETTLFWRSYSRCDSSTEVVRTGNSTDQPPTLEVSIFDLKIKNSKEHSISQPSLSSLTKQFVSRLLV